jgi:hypothetical protein
MPLLAIRDGLPLPSHVFSYAHLLLGWLPLMLLHVTALSSSLLSFPSAFVALAPCKEVSSVP